MLTKIITLFVLLLLAIIDIGPIPVTNLICIYALLFRPRWLKALIDKIYQE